MSYCNRCRVHIIGNERIFPLCQGDLTGKNEYREPTTFPEIPIEHPHRTMLTWIAFGAVVLSIVSISINLSFHSEVKWSLFVIAGILSLYISAVLIVKKRSNIPKTILWQFGIISILSFIWDLGTGFHGWSIDYVIPVFCICAMILMAAVSKILKLHIEEYIVYLIIDSIMGIVSLILIIFGTINVVLPSALSFGASAISLAALYFFEGKALKAEIYRRMHL